MEVLAQWGPWRSGEQGSRGLLMPEDGFAGLNVLQRNDGCVQARAPLALCAATGLPNGGGVGFLPIGNSAIGYVVGGNFWQVPITTIPTASINRGAFAFNPSAWCVESASATLFAANASIYRVTTSAAPALLFAGPLGTGISYLTTWNDRLWASGGYSGGVANRLYYSDPGNYASWPAANFLDISSSVNNPIQGLVRQNDSLLVFVNHGDRVRLHRISGTPGVSLRNDPINDLAGMTSPRAAGSGRVWGTAREADYNNSTVAAGILGDSLRTFPWVTARNDDATRIWPSLDAPAVNPLQGDLVVWPGGDASSNPGAIVYTPASGFSHHRWATGLGISLSQVAGGGSYIALDPTTLVAIKQGTAGTPVQFYLWMPDFQTAGMGWASTNQENSATIPTVFDSSFAVAPSSIRWQPQEVVVDFRQTNPGSGAVTNHFDIFLECLSPYEGEKVDSVTVSWDDAASNVALPGERRRFRRAIGASAGGPLPDVNLVRARLSNLRGVAIERIEVRGSIVEGFQ